jgi:hypothetical protein
MKNRNINRLIIDIVVGIIVILYIFILYVAFFNVKLFITSESIKYLCILLCFLLSILSNKDKLVNTVNHRDIFLLQLALFITVIADLCLIIFNYFILGVIFFSLVQIMYSIRYTTKRTISTLVNFFIIFLCIMLSYGIVSLFIVKIDILLPISMFYFICLLTSVIKAIKVWKNNLYPSPSKYMIVLGMILFLLCDICVALSNITLFLPLSGHFIARLELIASFLIWVFYIPSQLLLSLSGNHKGTLN